jgi:putative flippase GtrA
MGIVLQMGTLLALTSVLGLSYLIATAIAVEIAVLHNFFWHEHWTWADRRSRYSTALGSRLLRFHFANGAFSLAGNLILMRFFVEGVGLNYLFANAIAIAVCAIFNFFAGDRLVFRAVELPTKKENRTMCNKANKIVVGMLAVVLATLLYGSSFLRAAELHPETVKAWLNCVELTERRIRSELSSQNGFLALDFQDPPESARERQAVLSGDIPIKQVKTVLEENKTPEVPDGMIHHWRGSAFIPGVTLDFVFSRVKNPSIEDTRQEDVLDSRVLESSPGQLKLYLKLQRSKIVTVRYNTEHLVKYKKFGSNLAFSSSTAIKISELERSQGNAEREKPEGQDRGFLWRMNSYWRYQQVPGGVIVECESLTLSRSIPFFLEYLVRPIINRVARESMHRTLESMRARMIKSFKASHSVSVS